MISDNTILSEKNIEYFFTKTCDYEEVEYLEASGAQFIDTGYYTSSNTRIVSKISPTSVENGTNYGGMFYGSSYPDWANGFGFEMYIWTDSASTGKNGPVLWAIFGSSFAASDVNISAGDILLSDFNKNNVTVYRNNDLVLSHSFPSQETLRSTASLKLFSLSRSSNFYGYSRIYYLKIYENDNLVHDYIPVLKNNIPAMYDKITKQFLYNSGTGSFSYGQKIIKPNSSIKPATLGTIAEYFNMDKKNIYENFQVNVKNLKYFYEQWLLVSDLPQGYTHLQYAESTGHQCIDTDLYTNDKTRIIMKCSPRSVDSSNIGGFFFGSCGPVLEGGYEAYTWAENSSGARNSSNIYAVHNSKYQYSDDLAINVDDILDLDFNRKKFSSKLNGEDYFTCEFTNSMPVSSRTLKLFSLSRDADYRGAVRIYNCQIYDDDILVGDFVPCKNSEGIVGMYNKVKQQFHTSTTDIQLIASPEL